MSVCLVLLLFVDLSVCLSVCLSTSCLSVCLSVYFLSLSSISACLLSLCISTTDALFIDISLSQVEIDRRMLDFCVGLDTEFSEIVEGSHLYFPKTKFEQVYT